MWFLCFTDFLEYIAKIQSKSYDSKTIFFFALKWQFIFEKAILDRSSFIFTLNQETNQKLLYQCEVMTFIFRVKAVYFFLGFHYAS